MRARLLPYLFLILMFGFVGLPADTGALPQEFYTFKTTLKSAEDAWVDADTKLEYLKQVFATTKNLTPDMQSQFQAAIATQQQQVDQAKTNLATYQGYAATLDANFTQLGNYQAALEAQRVQDQKYIIDLLTQLSGLLTQAISDLSSQSSVLVTNIAGFAQAVNVFNALDQFNALNDNFNNQLAAVAFVTNLQRETFVYLAELKARTALYQSMLPVEVQTLTGNVAAQEKWVLANGNILLTAQDSLLAAGQKLQDQVKLFSADALKLQQDTAAWQAGMITKLTQEAANYRTFIGGMIADFTDAFNTYDAATKQVQATLTANQQPDAATLDQLLASLAMQAPREQMLTYILKLVTQFDQMITEFARDAAQFNITDIDALHQDWLAKKAWLDAASITFNTSYTQKDTLQKTLTSQKAGVATAAEQQAQTDQQHQQAITELTGIQQATTAAFAKLADQSAILKDYLAKLTDSLTQIASLDALSAFDKVASDYGVRIRAVVDMATAPEVLGVMQQFSDSLAKNAVALTPAENISYDKSFQDQLTWLKSFGDGIESYRLGLAKVTQDAVAKRVQLSQTAAAASLTGGTQVDKIMAIIDGLSDVVKNVLNNQLGQQLPAQLAAVSALAKETTSTLDPVTLAGIQQRFTMSQQDFATNDVLIGQVKDAFGVYDQLMTLQAFFTDVHQAKLATLTKSISDGRIWIAAAEKSTAAAKKQLSDLDPVISAAARRLSSDSDAVYGAKLSLKQIEANYQQATASVFMLTAEFKKVTQALAAVTAPEQVDAMLAQITRLIEKRGELESLIKKFDDQLKVYQTDIGKISDAQQLDPFKQAEATYTGAQDVLDSYVSTFVDQTAAIKQTLSDLKKRFGIVTPTPAASTIVPASAAQPTATVTAAIPAPKKPVVTYTTESEARLAEAAQAVVDFSLALDQHETLEATLGAGLDNAKTIQAFAGVAQQVQQLQDWLTTTSAQLPTFDDLFKKVETQITADQSASRVVPMTIADQLNNQRKAVVPFAGRIKALFDKNADHLKAIAARDGDLKRMDDANKDLDKKLLQVGQLIQEPQLDMQALDRIITSLSMTATLTLKPADVDTQLLEVARIIKRKDQTLALMAQVENSQRAVTATVIDFKKVYGDLTPDTQARVDAYDKWIGGFKDVFYKKLQDMGALRDAAVAKQQLTMDGDLKALTSKPFEQQLEDLENRIQDVRSPGDVANFMRYLKVVYDNRYGNQPGDVTAQKIEANKKRFGLLVDWLMRNVRFRSVQSLLQSYYTVINSATTPVAATAQSAPSGDRAATQQIQSASQMVQSVAQSQTQPASATQPLQQAQQSYAAAQARVRSRR